MKRTLGTTLIGLTSLSALVYGISCAQPKINCTTGHGGFAMRYTLKPGSVTGTGDCDKLKGDTVGLEKYNPQKEGDPIHQDFTKAILAVRTKDLGDRAALAASVGVKDDSDSSNPDHLDSIGDFASTDPDANDVCTVPSLSAATQKIPAFTVPPPADMPDDPPTMVPATDRKIEWSKLRVYATTALPGTQIVAEMTYTDTAAGCSARYDVVGLYPAVSCKTTEDCDPEANPDAGRVTGSGINPDLKSRVTCDPDLLLCVLTAPPEALR